MSERKILQKLIQDGKDAEAKLEALDKPKATPKIRHGDYGMYSKSGRLMVADLPRREIQATYESGHIAHSSASNWDVSIRKSSATSSTTSRLCLRM